MEAKAKDIVKRIAKKILINGKLVATNAKSFPIINPAKREAIGEIADCTTKEVNQAAVAASNAFQSWRKTSALERCNLFIACAEKLEQHKEELAALTTLETGNAFRTVTSQEAINFINIIKFYSALGSELKGETVPLNPNMLTLTIKEPLGVVAGIIPWNVPLLLFGLKMAPAIIAGNTIIIKPSEFAPFAVLRAAEIMNSILPKGVLNIVTGYGHSCGEALVNHPMVKKVTFTGSVETGRRIYQNAAAKLIPVTLELGGKSPMIICSDADLDEAVEGSIIGMRFTRQGQSCSAASRIFIHEKIFAKYLTRLGQKLNKLVIGDPFDKNTDIGSISNHKQYEKINDFLKLAKKNAKIKLQQFSKLPADKALKNGLFLQPTIITGVEHSHKLVQEEIFGPVTCLFKWNDYNEVIKLANMTSYGLAATIWTKDINLALKGCREIDAGLVQVNQNAVVQANLPYGGFKNSGLGQEGTREAMLEHFTKRKTIIIKC